MDGIDLIAIVNSMMAELCLHVGKNHTGLNEDKVRNVRTHMHVRILHVCACVNMCVCMCVCTCVRISECMYVQVCACVHVRELSAM